MNPPANARERAYLSAERAVALTAAILLLVRLVFGASWNAPMRVASLIVLPVLIALPRVAIVRLHDRAVICVLAMEAIAVAANTGSGFGSPGTLLAPALGCAIAVVVLSARFAAFYVVLCAAALLGLGVAFHAGVLAQPNATALDVHNPAMWLRILGTTLGLSAGLSLMIVSLVESADAARARADGLLVELERSVVEKETAERSAIGAERLETLGQVSDAVGHELAHSFLVVLNWVEVLASPDREASEQRAAVDDIRHAARHAASLARQLVAYGKSRPDAAPETVRLDDAVAASSTIVRRLLAPGTVLRIELGGAGAVPLSAGQVDQLIVNLALNAKDALGAEGTFTIQTGREDGARPGHFLRVADTGSGMDPSTLTRAFDPFFTTKGGGASGLGLSAVQQIVTAAGGEVEVESRVGAGTKFTLWLPEQGRDPGATPTARAARGSWRPGAPWRDATYAWVERIASVVALIVLFNGLALAAPTRAAIWVALAFPLVVVAALPLAKRLAAKTRAALMTGAFHLAVAAAGVAWGFQPGTLFGVAVVSVLGGMFLGSRGAAAHFGFALFWLSALLAARVAGVAPEPPPSMADASRFINWVRVTITFVAGATMVVLAARRVLAAAEGALAASEKSLAALRLNVEARERAERVAVRARDLEERGQVSSAVAHELNNLLCVVINWGQILGTEVVDAPTQLSAVSDVRQAAHRAVSLARQLLQSGRVEEDARELVPLDDAVEGALRLARNLLPRTVVARRTLASDGRVALVPGQMDQVIVNLALNARDAMEGHGMLTVETGRDARADLPLFLRVADTGAGMDAATRERIFEPFFTTKGTRGNGLGLVVVRDIVTAAGGVIEVATEPGKGTTFTLRFPAAGT